MLYVPEDRPVKILPICQLAPPSMLYSKSAPVAIIVILPSSMPQSLGFTASMLSMLGALGATSVVDALLSQSVTPISRTRIV